MSSLWSFFDTSGVKDRRGSTDSTFFPDGEQSSQPPAPIDATKAEQDKKLIDLYHGVAWMIDPRKSKFMPIWDVVMLAALAFTAIVTPFEVTFIDEGAVPKLQGLEHGTRRPPLSSSAA